ncbi:MAG: frc 3 [Betaproteobacteria bacterium]|nr:frc 3 [Betaproteobacteria bacterium]
MPEAKDDLPLSPYFVLDLTRARAGPTAARQLADWGADVIKVEELIKPGDEDNSWDLRHGSDFQNLHRNKRSITINLKDPDGLKIFKKLADKADVIIENYRPDVKHRLGIDYETLKKTNPRLVYASISGFGQDGPYSKRPGLDQIVQGVSGLMSITGKPGDGPMRTGIAISDSTSGVYLSFGILLALLQRERTGVGQWVNTSLVQALVALMDFQAARWLIDHEVPPQSGNDHPTGIPQGVFKTKDGHINISGSGTLYPRLCNAIEMPELIKHADYVDFRLRSKNRAALNKAIETKTTQRTSAEWVELLNKAGVPCGPIYSIDQMFADPQVKHIGIAQSVEHPTLGHMELVGQGVNLGNKPVKLRTPTPERGQHNDEILKGLGYSEKDIASLRERKVI